MHHHDSPHWTAHCLGVKQSRLAHGDLVELKRFAEAVGQPLEKFAQWSVQCGEGGKRTLRGNEVTVQLHYITRRLCPACIAESQHHRFWWDLGPITTCPRHQLCLIDTCVCGSELKWRDSSLLHCDQGRFFANLPRREADPLIMRTDRYLLSRFGCAEHEDVPILDEMQFVEACHLLERIGAAREGYSKTWRNAKSLGIPLNQVQARGFEILADGRLDEVLTHIYDGYIASGGKPEKGFSSCYGWLFHWFNYRRRWKGYDHLAEAILHHGAARFPIVPRAKLGSLRPDARKKLSMKAAAKEVGLDVLSMRSIGLSLGIINEERTPGRNKSFPADVVDRIARDMGDALSFKETLEILGVGGKVLHRLIKDQSLIPALAGGGKKHAYVFRRTDVDNLLSRLAGSARQVEKVDPKLISVARLGRSRASSVADGVRLILDNRVKVRQLQRGAVGLKGLFIDEPDITNAVAGDAAVDAIPFAAAAKRMRLNSRGLRLMINNGVLKGVSPGATVLPSGVVAKFCREFMMAGEICERTGVPMQTLRPQLDRAGFVPDEKLATCLHAGYPRPAMEAFLAKLEAGDVSLSMPDPARNVLIAEARRILKSAAKPLGSDEIIRRIRRKTGLGPSDQTQFFFATMNEEKAEFVFIVAAGWWLRSRPFLGRVFSVDEKPSYHDFVEEAVLEMIQSAKRPLSKEDIVSALQDRGLAIAASSKECFLRKLTAKHRDKIARLIGLGYWDRVRPYAPAFYDPKSYPRGLQTLDDRIAACVVQHLTETKKPASRAEIVSTLSRRGVFDAGDRGRGQIPKALQKSGKVVWRTDQRYWLCGKRYD
jgi:hypothetical protein